jgi:hypothetical protein
MRRPYLAILEAELIVLKLTRVGATIKLQLVAKNGEQGEYLGMSRWGFVVAQAVDDGSRITGGIWRSGRG